VSLGCTLREINAILPSKRKRLKLGRRQFRQLALHLFKTDSSIRHHAGFYQIGAVAIDAAKRGSVKASSLAASLAK